MRRGSAVLAGLTACGVLVTGCGGTEYEYVSNGDAGLHFRVPDAWAVLEVDDDTETGVPEAFGETDDGWLRVIDASPAPALGNAVAPLPLYPVGLASVGSVGTLDDRDQLDYADAAHACPRRRGRPARPGLRGRQRGVPGQPGRRDHRRRPPW